MSSGCGCKEVTDFLIFPTPLVFALCSIVSSDAGLHTYNNYICSIF